MSPRTLGIAALVALVVFLGLRWIENERAETECQAANNRALLDGAKTPATVPQLRDC